MEVMEFEKGRDSRAVYRYSKRSDKNTRPPASSRFTASGHVFTSHLEMVTSVRLSRLRIAGRGYHPLPLPVYLSFKGITIMTGNGELKRERQDWALRTSTNCCYLLPLEHARNRNVNEAPARATGTPFPVIPRSLSLRSGTASRSNLAFLRNVYFALRMFSFLNDHVFSYGENR